MPYVRISIMRPQRGHAERVHEILQELTADYARQPGCVLSYVLEHRDGSGRYGRIGVWESEAHAEHAAQAEHDLALRSELNGLIIPDSHEELSFEGLTSDIGSGSKA
jgi:quinol monooxygenase YgiN